MRKTESKLTITALLLAMLLVGCTQQEAVPTTSPKSTEYSGTLTGYAYRYESIRDRHWEEDVLYLAEVFLGEKFSNGHPVLTDMEFQTHFTMDNNMVEYKTYYDPQMREAFLLQINALLGQIPKMADFEILYGLQRILAQLGDLHSYLMPPVDTQYPLWVTPFYTDEGVQWRAVMVPEREKEAVYATLESVNDVPIEEVTKKLRAYISCENPYAGMAQMEYMITSSEALSVIGVAAWMERDTRFTLRDDTGKTYELVLAAGRQEAMNGTGRYYLDTPLYQNIEDYYWWEYQQEENLLYARFNEIVEDPDLVYSSFLRQLSKHVENTPETETVVIDLRDNPGGQFHASLAIYISAFLNKLENQKSYILLDSSSYSAAIYLSSNLRQMAPGTVLVGAPGGQPANFFASVHSYNLPHSGEIFAMSDTFWVTNESDWTDALMPDVVIYQTLEDLINGKDTVLEAIKNGDLKN